MVAAFWQVRDPGNAGTVIRSADAAGCSAVVLVDDCVDMFNPKVVRSTAGITVPPSDSDHGNGRLLRMVRYSRAGSVCGRCIRHGIPDNRNP